MCRGVHACVRPGDSAAFTAGLKLTLKQLHFCNVPVSCCLHHVLCGRSSAHTARPEPSPSTRHLLLLLSF